MEKTSRYIEPSGPALGHVEEIGPVLFCTVGSFMKTFSIFSMDVEIILDDGVASARHFFHKTKAVIVDMKSCREV